MSSNTEFTNEQKEYLSGFFSAISKTYGQIPFVGQTAMGQFTNEPNEAVTQDDTVYSTPIEDLCKEEQFKLEKNGLDIWDTLLADAAAGRSPASAADLFRYKFFGLFYVKPAQNSFMLRNRIPGGLLNTQQMRGLAHIARDWGGGFLDITTRGNIQIREILPKNVIMVFNKLTDLGLTPKGSGADNIRNITTTPTTGFDPLEFIDVMPYAKAMHHTILNNRDLYGLPRKFNISFDSGGAISVCSDTNDLAFYATKVGPGQTVESGVYFRVQLAGITGHKQFASDCGLLLQPNQCVAVAAAMIRVFIENGDRTNRSKARLKYLIDKWGVRKFLEETQKKISFSLQYFELEQCITRKEVTQHGHIGIHPQKQNGMNYVGVSVPAARLSVEQFEKIADLVDQYGANEIRLSVWQNFLIPHVMDADVSKIKDELHKLGLPTDANNITNGIVACTGNVGCKFAASNTKAHALELSKHLEQHVKLDHPINIHLTGCHHSCAQHYVGDIGLLACSAQYQGENVEGYNVYFGGGVDNKQAIAKEVFKNIPFQDLPSLLVHCLLHYQLQAEDNETFYQFINRHSSDELKVLFAPNSIKQEISI